MITCAVCGTANDDWRPFCVRCSARFGGGPASGPPPGTLAPPPPPPASPPRTASVAPVVVAAVIVALALGGGAALLAWPTRSATPQAPASWDTRILALVRFVERARDLGFERPVRVDFLPQAAFKRFVTDDGKRTARQVAAARAEMRDALQSLRAVGLAEGDVDLGAAADQIQSETLLALYDSTTQRITVRGTRLDVATRVTIVHELTHALQDQRFGLDRLSKIDQRGDTNAATTLVEGDASDVEQRYVDSLGKSERAAYDRATRATEAGVDLTGVPEVLTLSQQMPYDFGPALVTGLRSAGGTRRLDAAFRSPPRNQALVVRPIDFLAGRTLPRVAAPPLPRGATGRKDAGEFGTIGWLLMLAERGDTRAALAAADGVANDRYVTYRRGSRLCVAIAAESRGAAATRRLAAALRSWSRALPAADPEVRVSGTRLVLRACDPGPRAKLVTKRGSRAYVLLTIRNNVFMVFAREGVTPGVAWCAGSWVADRVPLATLDDSGAYFGSSQFRMLLQDAGSACVRAGA